MFLCYTVSDTLTLIYRNFKMSCDFEHTLYYHYRPLSEFRPQEIPDVFNHDASCAVCLFPIASGALLVQNKPGLELESWLLCWG